MTGTLEIFGGAVEDNREFDETLNFQNVKGSKYVGLYFFSLMIDEREYFKLPASSRRY